jgi:glycine dehydrogenase subunit 2
MKTLEPVIYDMGSPGRCAASLPALDVPSSPLPEAMLRADLPLPEVSEIEIVRHFTRLSQLNHAVDTGFYPLGSCTMKYNPKVNDRAVGLPGFANIHPYQDELSVQGALLLMYELQQYLGEVAGLPGVTLQPAAGAHGEFTGMLIIRAYHLARGDRKRAKVLIPDSAHGTNPATSAMGGYQVVEVPSDVRGNVDLDALRAVADDTTVGIMFTNPNTLGLFDENVRQVCEIIHDCGGLVYGDGANLNAIMGIVRPGDLGFDVIHMNLHKTFAVPHGGGGPGAGPVCVTAALAPFLPDPVVARTADGMYTLVRPAQSVGRVKSFYGQFAALVRAYVYIRMLGSDGLREAAENAVLNANYLMVHLKDIYDLPHDRGCMHEFVLSGSRQAAKGVRTLDIAKRLMDFGIHPPTVYFPLIVPEAMMIEPTETETKETLDNFIAVMRQIAQEATDSPDLLHSAPHDTPVGRMDEVKAAREPILRWKPGK